MHARRFSLPLCALLATALVACAPTTRRVSVDPALARVEASKQREIALESQMDDQFRLLRVAWPLLVAGADLCGKEVRAAPGFVHANRYVFPKELRDTAARVYGVGESLKVLNVFPGSPADTAGVKAGDTLISLAGRPATTGQTAARDFTTYIRSQLQAGRTLPLVVSRNGQNLTLGITPVKTCAYDVLLGAGDEVNAYADGARVVITPGMMRFARDDTELSLVIAHELAHNAMGHIDAQTVNVTLGSIVDILAAAYGINTQGLGRQAGQIMYSQDFEAEADYVGLYIMARGGGDIANAPKFWRRMAAAHPASIEKSHAVTHPSTPERFLALEKTVVEIQNKRAHGEALVPARR